jgi:hypothetical protein
VHAATLVLQQGLNSYAGTADTTLFDDRRDNSAGGFPYIFSGVTRVGSPRRTLIKFDLPTTLTAQFTVTSVSLRLSVDQARPGAQTHTVYRMTRAWNEGNLQLTDISTVGQGAPAQPGDATWNSAADGVTSWTTSGGDFAVSASGSGVSDIAGTNTFLSGAGMVSDVQSWIATPSVNRGWAILGNETTVWDAKRFASSESATASLRPLLTITYTTPAPTAAADWQLFE